MLKGKRIIVVGGSTGIGLTLSEKLLREGCAVVIASRSLDKLNKARAVLQGDVSIYQLDAGNEEEVLEFMSGLGRFDHLVSTIKPAHFVSPFSETVTAEVKAAFDAKFWGQYHLVRHGAAQINQNGCVVLTSGIASRRSYAGFSGIGAVNGAIESLVKSLAVELAPIRINAVCPGFIERFSGDAERLKQVRGLGGRLPLSRLGSQAEVADAYMFLLKSTYSTGMILEVDGGELCA